MRYDEGNLNIVGLKGALVQYLRVAKDMPGLGSRADDDVVKVSLLREEKPVLAMVLSYCDNNEKEVFNGIRDIILGEDENEARVMVNSLIEQVKAAKDDIRPSELYAGYLEDSKRVYAEAIMHNMWGDNAPHPFF